MMESVAEINRQFAPTWQAIAEMNRSMFKPAFLDAQALGASLRSDMAEVMRLPTALQLDEVIRATAPLGASFKTIVDNSAGKEFRAFAGSLQQVDWSTVIEESLEEEAEEEQTAELKSETLAAASFLNEKMHEIVEKAEQTPKGLIAALVLLHEKVVESPLGEIAKWLVIRLLNIIIDGTVFTLILSLGGASQQAPSPHRETLKNTKQHVLREAGYHPQLRIVSIKSRLNVRMKPNRKSHVVGQLYPYTVVIVIGHAGKWAKVCFANGHSDESEGWVFNKYLSKLKK